MKSHVEEIDSCNKKLNIEIPLKTYNERIKAYYQKLGREVSLPGFRKGKVPVSMLEKRFGPDVKKEVLTQLVSDSITQAVQDNKLKTVGEPQKLQIEAEEGTDISVTADVEVVPEFELKDFSGIELTLKVPQVTEEEIDQVIEVYRQRQAVTTPITDRGVQKDDLVKIDFESSVDGQTFEGSQAKDYVIQVGPKTLVEGFDENLIGLMPGETREFKLKLPEAHPTPAIAGREVDFQVTLKGIQIKELPVVDDAFAQAADPQKNYQTVEEMRQGLRQGLEEYERKQARKKCRTELAAELGALHPVDIPERLVRDQIGFMLEKERQQAAKEQGQPPPPDRDKDEPMEFSLKDEQKYRGTAVKLLQQELVLGKLSDEWDIKVSDKEIDKEIKEILSVVGGGDLSKVKKDWAQSGTLFRLHARMRREKTLDALFEKVQVNEEIVDRETLKPDNENA
ncbi:MAG: trigger factor [Nitrospinaceae bacterium]